MRIEAANKERIETPESAPPTTEDGEDSYAAFLRSLQSGDNVPNDDGGDSDYDDHDDEADDPKEHSHSEEEKHDDRYEAFLASQLTSEINDHQKRQPDRKASFTDLIRAPRPVDDDAFAVAARPAPPALVGIEEESNKRGDGVDEKCEEEVDESFFDVIVIGMQEATFDTEGKKGGSEDIKKRAKNGKAAKQEKLQGQRRSTVTSKTDSSDDDDDASSSASYDDEDDDNNDGNILYGLDADLADFFGADGMMDANLPDAAQAQQTSSSLKQKMKRSSTSAGKKLLGATIKAGKVGLKAGQVGLRASQKMGKVTVKTAKTVNTLATARDHSTRPLPDSSAVEDDWRDQHILLEEGGGCPSSWSDTDVLHYRLEKEQLPRYKRALSYQLGEIRLLVYYRPRDAMKLDVVAVNHQATGKGGLANKGGIVAEVSINNTTKLAFLSAHLEAHEGEKKYAARNTSFMDILMGTKSYIQAPFEGSVSSRRRYDASLSSHFMFACGDFNYRTKISGIKPGSPEHIQEAHALVAAKDWAFLNHCDELRYALRMKECLVGFETPYCDWNPTFKVARRDGYEYNVKRSPSYTDRVLFKANDQLEDAVQPLLYQPVEHFTTSDHKPIQSVFKVELNDELVWKPSLPILGEGGKASEKRRTYNQLENDTIDQSEEKADLDVVDREKMHFFVSGIQCVIFPDEYDKIRKLEKADLPNPFVSFVSTPADAIQTNSDDSSKKSPWKMLGFVGNKGSSRNPFSSSKTNPGSNAATRTVDGYPSTNVIKETMRPSWKNDNLHFTLNTHRDNGSPINLSGAILYISLRDGRGSSSTAIGSYSLNLARLVNVSRNGSRTAPPPQIRENGHLGMSAAKSLSSRGAPASPVPAAGPDMVARRSSNGGRSGFGGKRPEPRCANDRNPGSNEWKYSKPSPALCSASSDVGGKTIFASPVKRASKSLHQQKLQDKKQQQSKKRRPPQRKGSLRHAGAGPSNLLRTIMVEDGDAPTEVKAGEQLEEFNIMSLRLDEALLEGGLEVARIKCSIDIWWTKDV